MPVAIEHENLTGHMIVGIAAGGDHSVLWSEDGTVFTFGRGALGQLGHGDTVFRFVPTPIETFRRPGNRMLRIERLGDGGGTVLVNGEPVSSFPILMQAETGAEYHLEAMAEEGSFFDRWVFDASGTEPLAVVTLDEDLEIGAVFGSRRIVLWRQSIGTERTGDGMAVSPLHVDAADDETLHFALASGAGDDNNTNFSVSGNELRTTGPLEPGEYSIRLAAVSSASVYITYEEAFTISVVPGMVEPKLAAGGQHTVLLSADGTVYTFGRGLWGQLGHGDQVDRWVPIPIEHENLSGHTIIDVAAGLRHTVLLSADGTVLTFGSGSSGQLGHGDNQNRFVPTPIEYQGLDGYIITGAAAGMSQTILTASDGTAFTFGSGRGGQLGHGNQSSRDTPTRIEHASLSGFTIRSVAAGTGGQIGRSPGGAHSLLLSGNGTVFGFGDNQFGQLGRENMPNSLVPVRVAAGDVSGQAIADISAGGIHTILRSLGGKAFAFGSGAYGRLGHGGTEVRVLPALIDHENLVNHNIRRISAGGEHSVLLSEDGTVFTFGRNILGQLGHGDRENRLVPVLIEHEHLSGHTIVEIAAGANHTVLLSEDGTVFTFGANLSGRLGHGDTEDRLVPTPIEFFRSPGHRMYFIDTVGDGHGSIVIGGQTISEFPIIGQLETGAELQIEAVAGEDSVFARWAGDIERTAALVAVVLDSDTDIVAVFNLKERLRFDAAMDEAGLSGGLAEPDADPFGEGVYNLLKYAFNMDLSEADHRRLVRGAGGNAGLPAVAFEDGPEPALVIEFVRRRDTGLIYTPRYSTDLATWHPANGQTEVTAISADWKRVVVRIPLDPSAARAFGSVQVTLP